MGYEFFYNILPYYALQLVTIFVMIGAWLLIQDSFCYLAHYFKWLKKLCAGIVILCASIVIYSAVSSIVDSWNSCAYKDILLSSLLPGEGCLSLLLASLYYSLSKEKKRYLLSLSKIREDINVVFPYKFIYSTIIIIIIVMVGNYLILHTFDLRQNEVEPIEGTIERIRLWFIYCVPWQIMNLLEFLSYFMIYKMIKFSMCSGFLCKNTKILWGKRMIMSIFVLSVIFSLYAKGEILFLKEKGKFMIQNMDLSMLSGQAVLVGVLMNALLIVYLARAKMIKPCVMGLLVMVCALPLMNFIQIQYFVNLWRNDTIVSYVWIFIMIVYMAFLLLGNNFLRKSTENAEQVQ